MVANLVAPGLSSLLAISHQVKSDRVAINENRHGPLIHDSTSDPLDFGDAG